MISTLVHILSHIIPVTKS